MGNFIAMSSRSPITHRIGSYRSGIRSASGRYARALVSKIVQWVRSAGRAAGAVLLFLRAAVLGLLWFVGYWIGRIVGEACRVILWFVGAAIRGFQDAF